MSFEQTSALRCAAASRRFDAASGPCAVETLGTSRSWRGARARAALCVGYRREMGRADVVDGRAPRALGLLHGRLGHRSGRGAPTHRAAAAPVRQNDARRRAACRHQSTGPPAARAVGVTYQRRAFKRAAYQSAGQGPRALLRCSPGRAGRARAEVTADRAHAEDVGKLGEVEEPGGVPRGPVRIITVADAVHRVVQSRRLRAEARRADGRDGSTSPGLCGGANCAVPAGRRVAENSRSTWSTRWRWRSR